MKLNKFILSMALCILPAMSWNTAQAQEANDATMSRTLLFNSGDMGSRFWRIPALATTNDGVVIAVADRRNDSNRDLPNKIDLVMRRSHDSGLTWEAPQVVVEANEVGGFGDAALGVHRPTGDVVIVAAHGNGLWEANADEPQHVVVIRSKDDGATWSDPVDITDMFYNPVEGVSPLKASAGFASSGTMLCDKDGRLSFVLVARETEEKWGPLSVYLCYSDDGGYNWKITEKAISEVGDESKVAQLSDDSYLMSIRNRTKAGRLLSRSVDRGETWSEARASHWLVDPACNGDLIAITPLQLQQLGLAEKLGDKAKNGLLLHSLALDPKDRKNVSVLASDDLGGTWRKVYTVAPDRSSYSALSLLPDGTLGVFSEEDNPEGGFMLWFTKVNLNALDF